MAELMDAYWRAPAIARTFSTAILASSIGIYMGVLPGQWFWFHHSRLLTIPPEIWRPVTAFFLTDPGLGIIMDTYFVFQYLSQLENGHPKFTRKEDLLWYLMFVGIVIIILCDTLLGVGWFLRPLILALCYTATQDQRGVKAGFFLFTVPAQLIPYCMLLVTLLMQGPYAFQVQLTGLVAAHLYDFLTRIYPEFGGGPNLIPTPGFLSRLVSTPRVFQRDYGTAIRNNAGASSGRSTGVAGSGPLPDSWKTRGRGHRLG
ncbi:Derlin [Pleurostoma richardsiae]|uniref:Derlin n=1 Tax=Pleurostoma richardsiae TaxID=41990 RepID=A0AA38RQ18_9PEZI|nr:Derlin [Pleurostoma richardsiae]